MKEFQKLSTVLLIVSIILVLLTLLSPPLIYYKVNIGQSRNIVILTIDDYDNNQEIESETLLSMGGFVGHDIKPLADWDDPEYDSYLINLDYKIEEWHGIKNIEFDFPNAKTVTSKKYTYQNNWFPMLKFEWISD